MIVLQAIGLALVLWAGLSTVVICLYRAIDYKVFRGEA